MDAIFESTLYTALRIDGNNICDYLESVTNLLAEFSWVYNFRNIDIFIYDVLEKIPADEKWPTSLKNFVTKCKKLASYRFATKKFQDTVPKDNSNLLEKLSDKKQYEVQIMSYLIKQVCQVLKCNTVIDVGSGLGYLDEALHDNFGLCCIGLDAVPKYTLAAKERLKSDTCKHSVLHKTFEVKNTDECLLHFKAVLNEAKELHCCCIPGISESRAASAVIVGLHSCGNLSQDMMELFCELEDINAFICIGCCYNKIKLTNFPMSTVVKHSVSSTQKVYPEWYPSISGLRLAAHGTRSHSCSFPVSEEREKNLFYRALLQCYIKKEQIVWKKPKRHVRTTDLADFDTYCSKMFEDHILSGDEKILRELKKLYQEKSQIFHRIRILLVLQMMLQPLWEAFVILDRVMYFKERNIFVEVLEMWDDSVSPRNLALCAYKR
ncbi:methyltransferase-like protein 25B isoform X3 [Parasteatoda tepidariorum]|uniref:methyltransferase-like protein 25B isoform X3 n=1 Tax=Parasteatoda tepidariorum TaxID=114398 RepID=UPI001C71F506|nr:protein RRNAD1 isoform X3 [Parasteatoda tepidariorum]